MEDMKGEHGGSGLRRRIDAWLAARKAKVNVVGAIGLVENMPTAMRQRPAIS